MRRLLGRFRLRLRERRKGARWEGGYAEGVLMVSWSRMVLVGELGERRGRGRAEFGEGEIAEIDKGGAAGCWGP